MVNKTRLQIDVPDDIKKSLQSIAEKQGRNLSDLIKEGIIFILQRYSV